MLLLGALVVVCVIGWLADPVAEARVATGVRRLVQQMKRAIASVRFYSNLPR